jgi:hypothetical protein
MNDTPNKESSNETQDTKLTNYLVTMNCDLYAVAELQFSESDPNKVERQAMMLLEEVFERHLSRREEQWEFRVSLETPVRCQIRFSVHEENVWPEVITVEPAAKSA